MDKICSIINRLKKSCFNSAGMTIYKFLNIPSHGVLRFMGRCQDLGRSLSYRCLHNFSASACLSNLHSNSDQNYYKVFEYIFCFVNATLFILQMNNYIDILYYPLGH